MATQRTRNRRPAAPRARRPVDPVRRPADPLARDPLDPAAPEYFEAPGPPPADWRAEVATASGLNVLAGIWLIIAPFVLGYRNGDPIWNDVVFGAIVGVLALARVSGAYRQHWLSWINALIGVWIFFSAWWLDSSATAGWNDIILGIIVFVLGTASASAGATTAMDAPPPPRWRR